MQNVDEIIQNAILLDTEISNPGRGKKSIYTAFMHKFYAPIVIDGKTYVAKMTVDESYLPGKSETNKKFYHVKAIEMVPSVGIDKSHTPIMENTISEYSISDLYDFVKTYDKDFTAAPEISPLMLNEDGTPRNLYHQTAEDFTEFDVEHKGAGTNDSETPFGIFMKPADNDIGLKGKKQMALYARIVNPLVANTRFDLRRTLEKLSPEYAKMMTKESDLANEYNKKIEESSKAQLEPTENKQQFEFLETHALRSISIDQMHTLLKNHLRPVKLVVDE